MTQYDHVEHKLFSEAKETEAQRKKQSQVVMKMQGELEHLKRENAKRLKVKKVTLYTLVVQCTPRRIM